MELSQQEIELFDKYSSNQLSEQEEESVALKLIADKPFNSKYQHYLEIKQGIRVNKLKTLLGELKDIEKNEQSEGDLSSFQSLTHGSKESEMIEQGIRYHTLKGKLKSLKDADDEPPRRSLSLWAPVGIAGTIFILLGFFFWLNGSGLDPLVDTYFEPYESSGGVRSDEPITLHQAYQYYDQKEYRKAITLFKKSIQEESTETKRFYLANAYLAQGNSEKAATIFQQLKNDNSDDERFSWYLALCMIDMDQNQQAAELLSKITESKKYKVKVADLLTKIAN